MRSAAPHPRGALSIICLLARPEPAEARRSEDPLYRRPGYAVRTAIAAALLIFASAVPVQAQQSAASEVPLPAPIPLGLLDSLSLTTEQRTRITADLETRKPTLDAILERVRTSGGATSTDRAALQAFVEERDAAIRAALTGEQRTRLDELLARRE